eukprot:TRINITY_DN2162_c0_g1_i1.p1 TRINITY_DN2162_c0_g1~~TRINITY_DN2162_c0_g1_i1.p1  ORF type:complete len:180 (-),score=38.14 TRINITY_DN2162_c0_g1_i1:1125-1664(-)
MRFVFVYGLPASGKLTISKELAEISGYRLFHNHLIVDALTAVFDFGSRDFTELREKIWIEVMSRAAQAGTRGLIFTFAPENTVTDSFVPTLLSTLREFDTDIAIVQIACSVETARKRISEGSRQGFKLTDLELFDSLLLTGTFERPVMPAADIVVNSDEATPKENATQIFEQLQRRWTV